MIGRWGDEARAIAAGLLIGVLPVSRAEPIVTTNTSTTASPAAEIVVTASREPHDIQSEPSTIYRLSASRKTREESVRTLPDMVEGVPSVLVQKTSYGQGSPYLRGFTGFRTLTMIDGIRLNNSVFRDGPNQYANTIDPLSIDRCELAMGPAGVLYGSDAIGGALNTIPIAPPAYSGVPVWERRLYYRESLAENSHMGRVQVGGRPSERIGIVGGYSLKDFGNLHGGRNVGEQLHTGYEEQDYDFRADGWIDDDSRLVLAHQTVNQDDAWRTHKTIYGLDWEGLAVGDDQAHVFDQQRDLTYLKYRKDRLGTVVDSLECAVSRQAQREDLYRVRKDNTIDRQGFDVVTWGTSLQLESDTARHQWVYGAEYYADRVDSYSRKYGADDVLKLVEIQGPVADDATYDSLGLYAQDTYSLSDGGLKIVPGIRYTSTSADADKVKDPIDGIPMSVNDRWDAWVGSLRLLQPLTDDSRHVVFAGVAQGFRAPNLSDLTRLDTARSTEIETASPDLDPERYVAYELGLKSRIERLTTQAAYYYTTIDRMIVRTPTGRVIDGFDEVTKRNSGDGYIQGAELSARYLISHNWSGWVSASWMDGQMDAYPSSTAEQARDYISRLMPPTAELGARWQTDTGKYWVEAAGHIAAKADKLSAEDKRDTQRIPPGGTPGYAVCDVRTGVRITEGFAVNLALENVLDTDYRIHGSGVNEPGRNLILTTTCVF